MRIILAYRKVSQITPWIQGDLQSHIDNIIANYFAFMPRIFKIIFRGTFNLIATTSSTVGKPFEKEEKIPSKLCNESLQPCQKFNIFWHLNRRK